jgi:hypothetical protein
VEGVDIGAGLRHLAWDAVLVVAASAAITFALVVGAIALLTCAVRRRR